MERYEEKAYAKINLGLDVAGRLPNGYHEVKMVMQTVDLWDLLTFEKRKDGITVTTDSDELSAGPDNLIYKAALLMKETYGFPGGVQIHLEKHIPIAAGMAGGSTDAAATMKGINRLFELSISEKELMELGVKIGADVPYCVMGGTALAEGIGEKLTELPDCPGTFLLIAKPDLNVSTKYVYEHLDRIGTKHHPDIDGMVKAIREGELSGVLERMENVLENVTVSAHPVIDEIKKKMLSYGALGALMSGSGPTVFGLFESEAAARKAYDNLNKDKLAKQIFVTTMMNRAGIREGERR